ncbi:MAG: hypothetical protein SGPRY_013199, partial [Prymnesium sp.]
ISRLLRLISSCRLAYKPINHLHNGEASLLLSRLIGTIVLMVLISSGVVQLISSFPSWGGFYLSSENTVRIPPFDNSHSFPARTQSALTLKPSALISSMDGIDDNTDTKDLQTAISNIVISRSLFFHEALYFTVVTLSTVGYGDVTPASDTSRSLTMVVIFVFLFAVPFQACNPYPTYTTPKLFNLPRPRTFPLTRFNLLPRPTNLLTITVAAMVHGESGSLLQVVLLVPSEPTPFFKEMIVRHARTQRVRYLRGDLLSNDDLERVRLDVAVGCFILVDKHTNNPSTADALTILRAISAHNYRPLLRLVVQLIEHRNKQYLTNVGISEHNIVCIEQLRMRMTAQSCLMPGSATIMSNLLTSFASPAKGIFRDYIHGLNQELYIVRIPEWFFGYSFSSVSEAIYRHLGMLMIAVKLANHVHLVVHPGKQYTLREDDLGVHSIAGG